MKRYKGVQNWQGLILSGVIYSAILFLGLIGCATSDTSLDPEYQAEIRNWQKLRIDSLKGVTGFLNLAGLYWLEDEVSSLGSDSINTIVFPAKAESSLGQIIMKNDSLWFVQNEHHSVGLSGENNSDTTLIYVDGSIRVSMSSGDLHWFIIKRGIDYGIRLKDYKHPLLTSFSHIENYPINERWKVRATWEAYDDPKIVTVHNQVGMELEMPVPGALHFDLLGNSYILEPVGSTTNKTLFIMIYDKTSGHETYGSGRYIDVPMFNEEGITYIDFNKAYNPPCAFTAYATCLFPHKANRLPIKIEAGEKYSGSH